MRTITRVKLEFFKKIGNITKKSVGQSIMTLFLQYTVSLFLSSSLTLVTDTRHSFMKKKKVSQRQ